MKKRYWMSGLHILESNTDIWKIWILKDMELEEQDRSI